MDSQRWQLVQDIFHAACEVPQSEREQLIALRCKGDAPLARKIREMLASEKERSPLDRELHPPAEVSEGEASEVPFEFVGPYHLLGKLGEGGMGLVYLAERLDWQSSVAIKFPRDVWISRDRLERFGAEQRVLAQLTHPSIARIYEGGTLPGGTPWFAMEYVNGAPITRYCDAHGSTMNARLRLFRAACEAVQYAHTQTIVHRDLKPSNILVNSAGEVKLVDFGIAKQIDESHELAPHTRTGQHPITMAYAAPEQVLENRVNTHSDVYSLGVVLYELLTGELPFDMSGLTPSQAEAVIGAQEPAKPSEIARRTNAPAKAAELAAAEVGKSQWADLDVLILKAMHKDAGQRYRSVDALIRDLDHYLNGEPLDARGDSLVYRLRKFVVRRRLAVSFAAAMLAVVVGLVSFFTYRLAKARDAALAESARTKRVERFMTDLLQAGDAEFGPSKDLRLIDVLDQGVQNAHKLDRDPQIQGDLYATLGTIFESFGEYGKAESLQQAGLSKRIASFGPQSQEAAESMVELGLLRAEESRLPEAGTLIRRAIGIETRRKPVNEITLAKYETALGQILMKAGKNREAIDILTRAGAVPTYREQDPTDYEGGLTLLVSAHTNLGEYPAAEPLCRQLVHIDETKHGANHPSLATDLVNLASIEDELGRHDEAEKTYRQALAIDKAWYPAGHSETADVSRLLSQVLLEEGKISEAGQFATGALHDLEKAHGQQHTRVALALGAVGRVALKRGAVDEAESDFKRELEIYYTVNPQYTGWALFDLGTTYKEAKDYAHAEQEYSEAIRSLKQYLPPDHPKLGLAELRLGEVLMLESRYREAEGPLLAAFGVWRKRNASAVSPLSESGKDLIRDYQQLQQPAKSEMIRSEVTEAKLTS